MDIENEMGVIVSFAQQCESRGWHIVGIQTRFPDATIQNVVDGRKYSVEFEYKARSFISHGHDPRGCDLIICWDNDWLDCPMTIWDIGNDEWPMPIVLDARDRENLYLRLENSRLMRELKDALSALEEYGNEGPVVEQTIGRDGFLALVDATPGVVVAQLARENGVNERTAQYWVSSRNGKDKEE